MARELVKQEKLLTMSSREPLHAVTADAVSASRASAAPAFRGL